MTNLNDVLLAMSNIPVDDPIAEIWGRGLQGGYKIIEYTGALPITINANGEPIIDYRIYGNTEQTDTPTPENPIIPVGCGVRTGNLLNLNRTYFDSFTTDTTKWMNGAATLNNAGTHYAETKIIGDTIKVTSKISGYGASFLIKASPNTTYTVSFETDKTSSGSWGGISDRDINGTVINTTAIYGKSATFTTHDNCAFLNVCFRFPLADGTVTFSNIMLIEGSTALPYEPYGYKLPILSNSTVTNIYLGEVETTRRIKKLVLDGTENVSYNARNDTVRRWVVTIPTANGTKTPRNVICTHFGTVNATGKPLTEGGICMRSTGNDFIVGGLYTDIGITAPSDSTTIVNAVKAYLTAQYAAGTPVTVWYVLAEQETGIVNEPLMKIGDYADTVSMEQAGVSIPTNKGTTVIDYDGTTKPSQMYIKYFGRVKND